MPAGSVLRMMGAGEDNDGHAMGFLRRIGPDIAHKAYQQAAKKYHPDCGGNSAEMQALNASWKLVRSCL